MVTVFDLTLGTNIHSAIAGPNLSASFYSSIAWPKLVASIYFTIIRPTLGASFYSKIIEPHVRRQKINFLNLSKIRFYSISLSLLIQSPKNEFCCRMYRGEGWEEEAFSGLEEKS